MRTPVVSLLARRQLMVSAARGAASSWAALHALPGLGQSEGGLRGGRLSADFEPAGAMWLGFDPGHQLVTARLCEALQPHVRIKLLVRDGVAQEQAEALLRDHRLNLNNIEFVQDDAGVFFVRDAAVFGLDQRQRRFIVDFKWTYYGWPAWCRNLHAGAAERELECARRAQSGAEEWDQALAGRLRLPLHRTPLAAEGGGIESNGRGVLIANRALWRSRNLGWSDAAIEAELLRLPGVRKVLWVPQGLAHDPLHRGTIEGPFVGWGTGGHTDEFVRFADANTILLAWVSEAQARSHPLMRLNQARMQACWQALQGRTDADGKPLRVIQVPLPSVMVRTVRRSSQADTRFSDQWREQDFPQRERRRPGQALKQVAINSYLNFVIANRLVLAPDYLPHGTPRALQAQVRDLLAAAFPGREIRFVDVGSLNWVGGGAHCATLNEPASKP